MNIGKNSNFIRHICFLDVFCWMRSGRSSQKDPAKLPNVNSESRVHYMFCTDGVFKFIMSLYTDLPDKTDDAGSHLVDIHDEKAKTVRKVRPGSNAVLHLSPT